MMVKHPAAVVHSTDEMLIATLGTEPQVVTVTLDLLRREGSSIREVVVIHTKPTGLIGKALVHLRREFHDSSTYKDVSLRLVCLDNRGTLLADVDRKEGSEAAFRALYREVLRAKRSGCRVHLSVAGGRKTMAVFGMATAQLLFDREDRLWHLVSEGSLLTEKRLHPEPGDQAHLIPIPVLRWSSIAPAATELILSDDPFDALSRQDRMRRQEEQRTQAAFLRGWLTPAERKLAELIVREGISNAEAGERLSRSPKTVANQLTSIYAKLREFFACVRTWPSGALPYSLCLGHTWHSCQANPYQTT